MEHMVLISKDILRCDYLPTYGNSYYNTPNIDELAEKGTVFLRHYTAAPSTAMSFTSMFTGMYPHETDRKTYVEVSENDSAAKSPSLFDRMHEKGYSCHLLWSHNYIHMAERFSQCFGKNTVHHDRLELNQYVGVHMKLFENDLVRNDDLTETTYKKLIAEIDTIDTSKPVFLWVHLPHVFAGRTGYGDDIDILDRFVGDIRKRFGDCIFITADHGCGNGKDGVTGYGFDLYESQIRIPLIAPRIGDMAEVDFPTSNTQLSELILDRNITKKPYVFSDTAYYAQPHRKLAIIKDNYKLIYVKLKKRTSLFDVDYDQNENIDLNKDLMRDKDRQRNVVTSQVLFYPHWDTAKQYLDELNNIRFSMWRDGTVKEKIAYGNWRKPFKIVKKRIKEIKTLRRAR